MENRCSVDGCVKPVKRYSYCYAHYMKNWRYGTPTPVFGYRKNIGGQRFGQLVALGYGDAGRWWCMCDCGSVVSRRQGDLNKARKYGHDMACGDHALHRRSDEPGYNAAHHRLATDLGPASLRDCTDCGVGAKQWSYDHTCPNERSSELGPYSTDPNRYEPRCIPCHKVFDLNRPTLATIGA